MECQIVQVIIKISGNLANILTSFPKETVMEFKGPISLGGLLLEMAINPLIITTIVVNNRLEDREFILMQDSEVLLIGPMAGG